MDGSTNGRFDADHQAHRWLAATAALGVRGRIRSFPNPGVGAILVKDGMVVGRGWTQSGGRPHAEAMALAQAGEAAVGATLYVTLEPCAHESDRGPSCASLIATSGVSSVVIGVVDPDHRTAGAGIARLRDAGIDVRIVEDPECRASLSGYLSQRIRGRPHVTLKLATSLDGCIALKSGDSRWITGPEARAHVHVERAHSNMILVGGQTLRVDDPRLDVRILGLEDRTPERCLLTRGEGPPGWRIIRNPEGIFSLPAHFLFIEGGAGAAASFIAADLVDRLLIYRAPILIGDGKHTIGDIGLGNLSAAHKRWSLVDRRQLGRDCLEIYNREDN